MGLMRDPARNSEAVAHVEHIRDEMLDCMELFLNPKTERPPVWARVQYADDIQSLWFLRSDLMHMLCDHCGETLAAIKVDTLTALFRGHIPKAQFASARRRR
ncbi:hypothetical protein DIC66_18190 [Rhodoferax lacus]|uniref:Uncharacterized protein n=2 Tax=Rhodoferax lacus TaxID=2184758 RepID=A0A3E1R7T9_9BURK|nr:hypothetical protein DIC66_18190 [Rhodoferax lacus]